MHLLCSYFMLMLMLMFILGNYGSRGWYDNPQPVLDCWSQFS